MRVQALKGRNNVYSALSGLALYRAESIPRAMPWAVVVCPFRAKRMRSASGEAKNPHVDTVNQLRNLYRGRRKCPTVQPKLLRRGEVDRANVYTDHGW